ncbi:LOW QUALITY PROTEIN: hypothetical protein MKX08_003430 [Trichoderma sp. CBMAI-0020]|nr:LOW QUALITY PROTEIN: hypothetical protein MKX08_003430 [Trichoderma sp. CBMAI-0020]
MLAQGLCVVIGTGCLFVPTIAVLPQYLEKKKALTNGIAAMRANIGHISHHVYRLEQQVGFPWATRALGFVCLSTCAISIAIMGVGPRPSKDGLCCSCLIAGILPLCLAMFFSFLGVYNFLSHVQPWEMQEKVVSTNRAFYIVPTINAASTAGRLAPNFLADLWGPRLQNKFGNFIPTRSRSKFVEQVLDDPTADIEGPSHWTSFDQIYATQPNDYGAEDMAFCLFPMLFSVGCLFSTEQTANGESAMRPELRERSSWTVYSMEFGLPMAIYAEAVDQEYPLKMDDEFITPVGIILMPPDHISAMTGVKAHKSVLDIIVQVVRHIYSVELAKRQGQLDNMYKISYSRSRGIETSLQGWRDGLPFALQSQEGSHPVSTTGERMSQLLRLAHAHVRWMLYRSFIRFVSQGFQAEGLDKYAGWELLSRAHQFPIHAIYFATLTLIYPMLEKEQVPTLKVEVIKGALGGMNVLEALAKNSFSYGEMASSSGSLMLSRYYFSRMAYTTDTLKSPFKGLPEEVCSPNQQAGLTDINKATEVLSQTYSQHKPPICHTADLSVFELNSVDQSNMQREVAPSQPGVN